MKQMARRKLCPKQKHQLKLTQLANNSSKRHNVMLSADLLNAGFIPFQLDCSVSTSYILHLCVRYDFA